VSRLAMLALVAVPALALVGAACKDEPSLPPSEGPATSAASAEEHPRLGTAPPPRVIDHIEAEGPATLDTLDVGPVKWPVPGADAFDTEGREVTPAESTISSSDFEDSGKCRFVELRGWLRITCGLMLPSVAVLGGSTDGLYLDATFSDVTITMPLAPGDRRALLIQRGGRGYGEIGLTPAAVLSETWVGTQGPHVVMSAPFFVQTF
jgi:hypothetical protein